MKEYTLFAKIYLGSSGKYCNNYTPFIYSVISDSLESAYKKLEPELNKKIKENGYEEVTDFQLVKIIDKEEDDNFMLIGRSEKQDQDNYVRILVESYKLIKIC